MWALDQEDGKRIVTCAAHCVLITQLDRALDMALEFPHADVLGFDLAPPKLASGEEKIPVNCRFDVRDANDGMAEWTDSVDVLHTRSADAGISDYNMFTYQAARCLRPNGVLLLATGYPVGVFGRFNLIGKEQAES